MVTGAAPRARSASMTPAIWATHLLMNDDHNSRTSGLVARAAWAASVTARCARNDARNA